MEINVEKDYKARILKIWEDYKDIDILKEEEYRKIPLLPRTLKQNDILFIGINPSYVENRVNKEVEEEFKRNGIGFYNMMRAEDPNYEETEIQYFKKFNTIAKYCGKEYEHIDLLFLRETNQNIIEILTYTNVSFLEKQLEISFELIEKINPKIIVVTNALASEFFGKKKEKHNAFSKIWRSFSLDFKNDFDNTIGTYRIDINGKSTPIIFSGMLSGQRALDIGSFERLQWQIKHILEISE